MSNPFYEMRSAVSNAQSTLNAADEAAKTMAVLLKGRLRKVSTWVLAELKRELSEFNANTKEWKS